VLEVAPPRPLAGFFIFGMRKAFTLIELLVVIVILGILTAIVVPRITGRVDQAKIEATKVQMKAIKNALEQ
jgi:general secretion pathway protein G